MEVIGFIAIVGALWFVWNNVVCRKVGQAADRRISTLQAQRLDRAAVQGQQDALNLQRAVALTETAIQNERDRIFVESGEGREDEFPQDNLCARRLGLL